MDQSAAQLATVARYGGSGIASPSFNRPQYVRYASVNTPREFGLLQNSRLDIEGVVGAEGGSQTLFFSFEILLPCRIGLRKILLNPYTDQYVSVSLSSEDGSVFLDADGFAGSSLLPSASAAQRLASALDLGYVACGYWSRGYCENDCQRSIASGSGNANPEALFDSPYASTMPAGSYRITVSSSEWPQLPYRFQLAVSLAGELSGSSDLQDDTYGRIGLTTLAGQARMRSVPAGALLRQIGLNGTATMQARPTGKVTRVSPYGT